MILSSIKSSLYNMWKVEIKTSWRLWQMRRIHHRNITNSKFWARYSLRKKKEKKKKLIANSLCLIGFSVDQLPSSKLYINRKQSTLFWNSYIVQLLKLLLTTIISPIALTLLKKSYLDSSFFESFNFFLRLTEINVRQNHVVFHH